MKKNYLKITNLICIIFSLLLANNILANNIALTKNYKKVKSLPFKNKCLKSPLQINGIVFPITINPITIPNLKVNQTADYTFSYLVTNTTNTAAKSYVWVDFDNNGIYTADEAIVTTIQANAVNFKVNVNYLNANFINRLKIGTLNIKFTTTTTNLIDDNLTPNLDERSTSLGIDGETETFAQKNISGITISGSVFVDGNGIKDNIIFGTGVGIIESKPLKAYLLDNTNTIIAKSIFSLGGSYKFENLYKGNYTIAVSLNDYVIGNSLVSIIPNLPVGWNLAGESYGNIGNFPLGIEPGLPNLQIPVVTQTASGGIDIFGINFALNRTPIASNDEIATPINTPIVDCNLVANDNDPDGNQTIDKPTILLIDPLDGLKKTAVTLPGKGEFKVNAAGEVSFVPVNNFLGVAPVITYSVKDKAGIESNVGIIKLVVKPVGVDDTKILDAEVPSETINILTNDGISGVLAIPAETFSNPPNADIIVNPNGGITFIFPPNQIIPNSYVYTYVLKTSDGVYSDPITATIVVGFSPAITLTKTAILNDTNNDGLAQAGETISYSFKVTNTGNVDVVNVKVNDVDINLQNAPVFPNLLKPGATGFLNIVPNIYTITAADILAGQVVNTATAVGLEPLTNKILNDEAKATVIFPILKIELLKTSKIIDVNGNCIADVGDKVQYTFTVTNKGIVDVNSIGINDPQINLVKQPISPSTLTPGKSGTLTAINTYTITQDDMDLGFVNNKANAQGKNLQNTLVTAEAENTVTVGIPIQNCTDGGGGGGNPNNKNPKIFLLKKAVFNDTNTDGFAQVGETITYTFTVTNTGNVDINNITINDLMLGMVKVPIIPNNLTPSQTGTYTVTYVLTQINIDAGKVSNTAVANGFDPLNSPVSATSGNNTNNTQPTEIILVKNAKISLVKKSLIIDINSNSINDVGDRIDYIFTVTNTGNVTLTNINITDNFVNVTGGPIVSLAPNGVNNTTFKASYTITQADVDKGFVTNTAIAKGFDPNNISVSDISGSTNENNNPTITPILQQGKIGLIKKVTNKGTGLDGTFLLGDIIIYSFTITNTGNVTLKNLVLTDPLFSNPNIDLTSTTLLPKATINVTANYTVTAANIAAGLVTNQALVTSLDPKNVTVQDYSGSTTDTDDKTVTSLFNGFFIPNVFTPNGDGINDTFEIVGLQNYTSVEIEVFNRWGNQVYKNLNYQNQWFAEGLNEGTYYYLIKLNSLSDSKVLKGWVLIKL